MYTIVITAAFFIIGFALLCRRDYHTWDSYDLAQKVVATFMSFVFAIFSIGTCIDFCLPSKTVALQHQLAAMRSSGSTAGSFALGSGSVDTKLVYHVYVVNADGSLTPETIVVSSLIRIIEDASLKDVGYWTETSTTKDYPAAASKWIVRSGKTTVVGEELRVPVGAVVHSFNGQ